MRIIEGDNIDSGSWSKLVKQSSAASWFQTQEAYAFFDNLTFLEAFAYAVESDGMLKGVVVGYIQKDGGKLKQFFSRRAIILGGPLLGDDISNEELDTLLAALKSKLRRKAIYIETRNFNNYSRWRKNFEDNGFEYEPHLDFHVKCQPKEIVWKNLKDNRRRQIKKALAEGVKIVEATSEDEVVVYYRLLSNLYKKKVKTPLFPIEFFVEFYRNSCGKFFLVKDNNKIIGGILSPILDNRTIYEWFICGEDISFKTKYPSVMATWAAMDYAVNNGIQCFDFMGAGKPDEVYGVRDFKSKFGGELVEYGRYLYLCKPWLFEIGKFYVKIMKKI